jgi:hypothetical protein
VLRRVILLEKLSMSRKALLNITSKDTNLFQTPRYWYHDLDGFNRRTPVFTQHRWFNVSSILFKPRCPSTTIVREPELATLKLYYPRFWPTLLFCQCPSLFWLPPDLLPLRKFNLIIDIRFDIPFDWPWIIMKTDAKITAIPEASCAAVRFKMLTIRPYRRSWGSSI